MSYQFKPDLIVPVTTKDNRTYKLNFSQWDEVLLGGDTISSGSVTWGTADVPTVGSITGSTTKLNVPLTGFALNKKYYATFDVVTSGGSHLGVFVLFVCGKPTNF